MIKRILVLVILIAGLTAISFTVTEVIRLSNEVYDFASPLGTIRDLARKDKKLAFQPSEPTKVTRDKRFSVLLLGIDRRSKFETAFRTDIMILLTVNQDKKKVVMTSVPRDLWVNGGRINATFVAGGFEAMQDAFEEITGQRPDAYIQCDFEDLVWIVDAMGGLEIELDTGFTDYEYPNDITKTYYTVSFLDGKQTVDGKNALILSRSRHGNNGEGSDFKRMVRQHKILKAMPDALLSVKSVFVPFKIQNFYETVTQHMVTNLTLADSEVLWSFYKDKDQYAVESFFVDHNYLYNPPLSDYGGAWVLVPINNSYASIHTAIEGRLGLTEPRVEPQASDNTQMKSQSL